MLSSCTSYGQENLQSLMTAPHAHTLALLLILYSFYQYFLQCVFIIGIISATILLLHIQIKAVDTSCTEIECDFNSVILQCVNYRKDQSLGLDRLFFFLPIILFFNSPTFCLLFLLNSFLPSIILSSSRQNNLRSKDIVVHIIINSDSCMYTHTCTDTHDCMCMSEHYWNSQPSVSKTHTKHSIQLHSFHVTIFQAN